MIWLDMKLCRRGRIGLFAYCYVWLLCSVCFSDVYLVLLVFLDFVIVVVVLTCLGVCSSNEGWFGRWGPRGRSLVV